MSITSSAIYISPLAYPYIVPPTEFRVINDFLGRSLLIEEIASNIADATRENAAIVIQGKAGSGRTCFAIHCALFATKTFKTCLHYFNQSTIGSKQLQPSILESPTVPICCQWKKKDSLETILHVVVLDDIIDLKHYMEVKLLIQRLLVSGKRKRILYFFLVDHPESRSLSTRMQQLLKYIDLQQPTPEQCISIANYKLQTSQPNALFGNIGNLTTLFAAIRSIQILQKHGYTSKESVHHLPYCIEHRAVEHEKQIVFDLMKRVFIEKKELHFQEQKSLLKNTDIRNVSLHYLENLPTMLASVPTKVLAAKKKRTIYLHTLRMFAKTDYIDFELSNNDIGSFSSLSTSLTASSSHGTCSGAAASTSSSAASSSSMGGTCSSYGGTHEQIQVQKEMTQYLRVAGIANIAVRELQGQPDFQMEFPFYQPRDLEFTKLNTKYSMQQSEKWFLTLVSIQMSVFDIPQFIERCMHHKVIAPIDSESVDIWNHYLQGHPFLHDKAEVLTLNDIRHLFRFLHMHIGAMTTQSKRLQLPFSVWLDRTNGLLGETISEKRKRKRKCQ